MDSQFIENIIKRANEDKTAGANLPDVEGYSSRKVRYLLNSLGTQAKHYLEIGIHVGSTFVPAMHGNSELKGTAVDNWSLFGNCRPQFEASLAEHLSSQMGNIQIIEQDCFTIDLKTIEPVDLYFYDGDHGRVAQYKAFTYFAPVLVDRFVALVDDFNWAEPREETYRAIKDMGWKIEWEKFLPARYERDTEEWWNGLWVAIVVK
jgi:hypothetical protein